MSAPYAAWHLIYNLDGSFRGYEWALDENGEPCPSRVYEQEGRDQDGNLIPDGAISIHRATCER